MDAVGFNVILDLTSNKKEELINLFNKITTYGRSLNLPKGEDSRTDTKNQNKTKNKPLNLFKKSSKLFFLYL